MTGTRRQRGAALLTVLAAVAVLAIVAGGVALSAGGEVAQVRTAIDRAAARAAADGAINRAILALLDRAEAARLPADGTPVESAFLGHRVRLGVADLHGRADLFAAPQGVIAALLAEAGASDPATRAQAWVETRQPGLADTLAGVFAAMGLDPATAARLAPLVTVRTRAGLVDPWAAPAAVLVAVTGAPAEEIAAFTAARLRAERPDLPALFDQGGLGPSPGRYWEITAEVRLAAQLAAGDAPASMPAGSTARGQAVVRRTAEVRLMPGGGYEILDWR